MHTITPPSLGNKIKAAGIRTRINEYRLRAWMGFRTHTEIYQRIPGHTPRILERLYTIDFF